MLAGGRRKGWRKTRNSQSLSNRHCFHFINMVIHDDEFISSVQITRQDKGRIVQEQKAADSARARRLLSSFRILHSAQRFSKLMKYNWNNAGILPSQGISVPKSATFICGFRRRDLRAMFLWPVSIAPRNSKIEIVFLNLVFYFWNRTLEPKIERKNPKIFRDWKN